MAKSKIPGPLERRHLIEKDLDPSAAAKIASAYLEEGRNNEALEFLAKAGDDEGLQAVADEAIEIGDAFLLASVAQLMGSEPTRDAWNRCADAADAKGKARHAETARRSAVRSEA